MISVLPRKESVVQEPTRTGDVGVDVLPAPIRRAFRNGLDLDFRNTGVPDDGQRRDATRWPPPSCYDGKHLRGRSRKCTRHCPKVRRAILRPWGPAPVRITRLLEEGLDDLFVTPACSRFSPPLHTENPEAQKDVVLDTHPVHVPEETSPGVPGLFPDLV